MRASALLLLVVLAVTWMLPAAAALKTDFDKTTEQCGGNGTVFARAAASAPHSGRQCDQCNSYRVVFVIATGRSGSTTMLAMLNAIPGFEISGEQRQPLEVKLCQRALEELEQHAQTNRTTPRNLRTAHSNAHNAGGGSSSKRRLGGGTGISAFYHPNDGGTAQSALAHERAAQEVAKAGDPHWWCLAQQAELESMELAHPPVGTVAVGRKAIRLDQLATLEFLRALFPCAQFVLTYRLDEAKQAKSAFWKKASRATAVSELANETATLLEFEQLHRDQVFAMPLENISVPRYNKLLAWLGVRNCSFTGVAHANSKGGYSSANATKLLNGTCTFDAQA